MVINVEGVDSVPFDKFSHPASPIVDFGPFLHSCKTGYDHGVVHPDGNICYL